MQDKHSIFFMRLFQLAVFALLIGRGWQHLFWDAPYRTLFWDEWLIKPILETFTAIKWEAFITSLRVDDAIQIFIKLLGLLYMLTAIGVALLPPRHKVLRLLLILSGGSLVFLAALYCKEKFYSIGQFFEYSLQFMSPFFLLLYWKKETIDQRFMLLMKVAIALTFICHGLYAMNYYPLPGQFMNMTMSITGLSENNARIFLKIAGIMDVIVAVLLFLPGKKALPALVYIIIWGVLTTVARIWAHFSLDFPLETLHQWAHESIYRFPHFVIPLVVFYWIQKEKTAYEASESS